MQDFQLKKHQKTFGGRALPGPAGELKRSPDPLAAKKGGTGRGRGGQGVGERGKGQGQGKVWGKGRGERIGDGKG